jgi:archaellum component FlaF (FlaF/FlaG flagellin family)
MKSVTRVFFISIFIFIYYLFIHNFSEATYIVQANILLHTYDRKFAKKVVLLGTAESNSAAYTVNMSQTSPGQVKASIS